MQTAPNEQFRDAIARAGLVPPEVIEPDRFHRFPGHRKGGRNRAAWCKQFADGNGGVFGDFSLGFVETWQAKRESPLSSAERAAFARQVEEARRQAEAESAARHAAAAEKAARTWNASKPVVDHPYLRKKSVQAFGLRQYGDALVAPMRDSTGRLHSLQFVTAIGEKRFLPGGCVRGHYHSIGRPDGGTICIAEGYATGASVHEATGHAVAVAFNAGNLASVAKALRAKFPDARLILCADDDARTEANPGMTKASEAARAVGGLLAVPDFGVDRRPEQTDFNDLAQARGAEAVKRGIEAARSAEREAKPNPIVYRKISEIEAKPIRWLWPGRIARGKITMIAGHPGLGKSQITASLAAIVTRGGRWPVDGTSCERGNVLFLSAEDDPADTIRPRLEAAGADLGRIHILDAVRDGFTSDGDERHRAFNLQEDIRKLEAVLLEIGDVALVIIDPVSAYLGGADSHNNAEVRALLAPLSDMAARAGAAVVAVSHLNKGGGGAGDALLRITGSLGFVAAARAAYIVVKDPENEARRMFMPGKNNIGPDVGGLAFGIESCAIGAGIQTSRIAWEAVAVNGVSADELLRTQADTGDRSEIEDAADWLRVALSEGHVEARELFGLGEKQGFHRRALQRARERIGARTKREGFGKGSKVVWFLPASGPIDDKKTIDDTPCGLSPMGESVTYEPDPEGEKF